MRLPPVCLNQAVVLTRDLTSHTSAASRSATSSQPQIMALVLPEDLGGLGSLALNYLEGEPLMLYHRLFVFT